MPEDIIFLPPDASGNPGELRIVDGEKYIVAQFFEAGSELALPSGRKVRLMKVFIDNCFTKLYLREKARDN